MANATGALSAAIVAWLKPDREVEATKPTFQVAAHEQSAVDILHKHGAEDVHVHELPGSRDLSDNPLSGLEIDPFLPDARI